MNRKLFTGQGQRRLIVTLFLVLCTISMGGYVSGADPTQPEYEWLAAPMTNVVTGETFTLHGLTEDGTPIVMHLIATWCLVCHMQFAESTTFLEDYPEKAHIVQVGIDTREISVDIANFVIERGYGGIFTTLEAEALVRQALMDLFGEEITMSVPQTVVISGNDFVYLGSGPLTSTEIADRIDAINQQLGK